MRFKSMSARPLPLHQIRFSLGPSSIIISFTMSISSSNCLFLLRALEAADFIVLEIRVAPFWGIFSKIAIASGYGLCLTTFATGLTLVGEAIRNLVVARYPVFSVIFIHLFSNLLVRICVLAECPCRRKFAKFMPNKILGYINRNPRLAVMHRNGVTDHLGNNSRTSGISLYRPLFTRFVHFVYVFKKALRNKRPLLY
ncbi:hypothetical protein TPE_2639 [Treponema pedis str. T A4]|uniref:Uncharacterized protein n=1 Tax=Treponema pedis str. T A4 TaxID=1291379 RepID=S6A568_9SPIR|nr:hypothetical protein TPE_2639 [Treponema pedis str. T A4]